MRGRNHPPPDLDDPVPTHPIPPDLGVPRSNPNTPTPPVAPPTSPDTHGAPARPGIYRHARATTAYSDKSDQCGAGFTNAYSPAAWTGPGGMSTLTGLYPPTHGVTAQGKTLPKAVYTLLDAFKEHGYRVPNLSYLTVDPTFPNIAAIEETGIDLPTVN